MMLGDIFYRGGDASYIYPFPISAARFLHRATQHNSPPNLVTRAPAQTINHGSNLCGAAARRLADDGDSVRNYVTANRLILTRPSDLSLPLISYDPNGFMVITSDITKIFGCH
jgi:hypothetical protein